MEQSIADKIFSHMEKSPRGTLFFADDFFTFGSQDNIRQSLARLTGRKKIHRAAKGIFYIPKKDKWDGTLLKPSLEDVAKAIARNSNIRVAPTGLFALNLLGLSTQVPGSVVYITDGAPRRIKTTEGTTICFRHTSDMNWFSYSSDLMRLVVVALKELGEANLKEEDLSHLKKITKNVSINDFNHDVILAPQWIRKILTT